MTEVMKLEINDEAKKELTYEEMITELKAIAKQLDNPATPVEEAVKLHKRGMELVKLCEEFLSKAELTISEVAVQPGD